MPASYSERHFLKERLLDLYEELDQSITAIQKVKLSRKMNLTTEDYASSSRIVDVRQSRFSTLLSLQKRKLDVQWALGRVEFENFGDCINCKRAIAYEELVLFPETKKCQVCAKLSPPNKSPKKKFAKKSL